MATVLAVSSRLCGCQRSPDNRFADTARGLRPTADVGNEREDGP